MSGNAAMRSDRPLFLVALLISAALVMLVGYLRLVVYREHLVPLADGLALLVCLWHRDRRLLWGMAITMATIALFKIAWVVPPTALADLWDWVSACTLILNVLMMALALHLLLNAMEGLEQKNAALETTNAELTAGNEQLAAREEEISQQNEELQSQTEELEQQTEELRRQTEELQMLHEEGIRRENALQTLLDSASWLRGGESQKDVMDQICETATELMPGYVCAAAIVERQGDDLLLRGHAGFGGHGPIRPSWAFDRSFASLAMEQRRTAYIEDVSLRPELEVPQPVDGRPFRSLLASPLWVEGRVVGVIKLYSHEPRCWTDVDFRLAEWLATQSSLVLGLAAFQRELERRRNEAEEASVQKTRFLAAVSHDVRTPTYAINLLAELVGRAATDPGMIGQLPQLAADLRSNARSLVALVSDVLDLARFDSGRVELSESEFSLCAAVDAEVRQLMPLAQAKGLELLWDSGPQDPPPWVRTDRMKLARVVGNLIGNAIKFTDSGRVRVSCLASPDRGLELRVSDTGVGIPPEQVSHIFDEFYQLSNPERDGTKGTGLGLAICKRLLDAMGCGIRVHSTPGAGSTFTLTIPPSLVVSPVQQAGDFPVGAGADGTATALQGLEILLVEDHDMTRRATAQLLAAEGALVAQAACAREAMHLLAHGSPQIMLLDLMLPDMDGSELLRRIRQRRPSSLRRVLVVSGDATAARMRQVMDLGADGIVSKPIDMSDLVAKIRSVLDRTPGHSASADDEGPRTAQPRDARAG